MNNKMTYFMVFIAICFLMLTTAGSFRAQDAEFVFELQAVLEHDDTVRGMIWNSDSTQILTWSFDGTARVWNVDGSLIQILNHDDEGFIGFVSGASWSPDEELILTWGEDRTAKIWEINTSQPLSILEHDGRVFDAKWNNVGDQILTVSEAGDMYLWNIKGEELIRFQNDFNVTQIAWNQEQNLIVTWSNLYDPSACCANLWHIDGELIATLNHEASIFSVTWSNNEPLIMTTSQDGKVTIWNQTGEEMYSLQHDDWVARAVWSSDYSHIITWSLDGFTRVWNQEGEIVREFDNSDTRINALWTGDKEYLVTSTGSILNLWTGTNFTPINTTHAESTITNIAWIQGQYILGSTFSGDLVIWDFEENVLTEFSCNSDGSPCFMETNSSVTKIATRTVDNTIDIWALNNNK